MLSDPRRQFPPPLRHDRLAKVAILDPGTPDDIQSPTNSLNALLARLAELGYVDGQNVEYEFRLARHVLERLPGLAAVLVATQPDVLWTTTSGAARAVAPATSTIPIIVAPVGEETMADLVSDFAHPPGNITTLTITSRERREKCLQLLKETVPGVKRVGVLFHPTPARIFELLASLGLPSVSDEGNFADEGGLLSLGVDDLVVARGAADYIDRILKGAKVADLPVVLPSKFILGVNLKTAQQLGITIPPSILLRADEVIE
jgi:putative tryptophan/tyrosine transport system substrate-binding protein